MYNTKNAFVLDALNQNDPYLQHYGIMGMHWGVRRYQPYGEGGYDPDHKGRNVGLAARLAGGGTSYSNLYGRGAKKHSVLGANGGINVGPSNAARKIGRGVNEALERMNYANDRLGQGIKNAGKKARGALNEYAGTMKTSAGKFRIQEDIDRYASYDTKTAMKMAAITFKSNARMSVNNLRHTSRDDVMKALGTGADRFKSAMSKTAVKSKEFGRNAAMTAALLGGAFDPTSSASQLVSGRYVNRANERNKRSNAKQLEQLGAGRMLTRAGSSVDRERFIRDTMGLGGKVTYPDAMERLSLNPKRMMAGKYFNKRAQATSKPEYFTKSSSAFLGDGPDHHTWDQRAEGNPNVEFARRALLSSLDGPKYMGLTNDMRTASSYLSQIVDHKSTDIGRRLLGL